MILFQKRFHAGITAGTTTLTFRAWKTPRVKPGGRYRCHPLGVLEVDAVDTVRVGDITDAEAASAGFASRTELTSYILEKSPGGDELAVVRVRFHHGGDGDRVALALDESLDAEARRSIKDKLAQLDERSKEGPWTKKTLAIIGKQPRVAASKLAKKLGRETADLKADIVKLKKLGLTQSFEVGYEISPRGRAFLKSK